MLSLTKRSPVLKSNSLPFGIILITLAFICGIFILSPVIAFFIKGSNPLAEMPESTWYYIFRGLFGISVLIAAIMYTIFKNVTITALPCLMGLIATLFPLILKIDKYLKYKDFIDKTNMTADYASYLVNIGVYVLMALLCLSALLFALGLLPTNIIIFVISTMTIFAVIFMTIDRAKNIESEIFSIFDILCFAYTSVAALMPVVVALSTTKNKYNNNTDNPHNSKRYQPKRMRT